MLLVKSSDDSFHDCDRLHRREEKIPNGGGGKSDRFKHRCIDVSRANKGGANFWASVAACPGIGVRPMWYCLQTHRLSSSHRKVRFKEMAAALEAL